jgi:lysophospholipase L1-like esterase
VGRIPGINTSGGELLIDGQRATLSALEGSPVGANAAGNRLLIIGDSILSGTASRYGGAMCSALVPLGWRVAVEAEAGQMVGFGRTVLRDRIYEGWDAAVVFLGTNFGGNQEKYERDLTAIVESLAPRPTLLLTATLNRPTMQQVNETIRTVASKFSNVSVLDWGTTSIQPGLLNRDRVHPSDAGRKVLVASIASAMGTAPVTPGACLPSKYTDDSLVDGDGVLPSTTAPGETIPLNTTTVPGATTTLPASATTTVPPGATATTVR